MKPHGMTMPIHGLKAPFSSTIQVPELQFNVVCTEKVSSKHK